MQEQKEGEGTQVVSEQLRRVLFYLSSRTSRADGGESVCARLCVLAWPLPQVLCWDILHTWCNDRDGPR